MWLDKMMASVLSKAPIECIRPTPALKVKGAAGNLARGDDSLGSEVTILSIAPNRGTTCKPLHEVKEAARVLFLQASADNRLDCVLADVFTGPVESSAPPGCELEKKAGDLASPIADDRPNGAAIFQTAVQSASELQPQTSLPTRHLIPQASIDDRMGELASVFSNSHSSGFTCDRGEGALQVLESIGQNSSNLDAMRASLEAAFLKALEDSSLNSIVISVFAEMRCEHRRNAQILIRHLYKHAGETLKSTAALMETALGSLEALRLNVSGDAELDDLKARARCIFLRASADKTLDNTLAGLLGHLDTQESATANEGDHEKASSGIPAESTR